MSFLVGAEYKNIYNYVYVGFVVVASVASVDAVISLADGLFALMAIPTMTSTLRLAPRVMASLRYYLDRYRTASGAFTIKPKEDKVVL